MSSDFKLDSPTKLQISYTYTYSLKSVYSRHTTVHDEGGGVVAACVCAASSAVAVAALSRVAGPEDRNQYTCQPVEEK